MARFTKAKMSDNKNHCFPCSFMINPVESWVNTKLKKLNWSQKFPLHLIQWEMNVEGKQNQKQSRLILINDSIVYIKLSVSCKEKRKLRENQNCCPKFHSYLIQNSHVIEREKKVKTKKQKKQKLSWKMKKNMNLESINLPCKCWLTIWFQLLIKWRLTHGSWMETHFYLTFPTIEMAEWINVMKTL